MNKSAEEELLAKLRSRLAEFDGKAISILGETEAGFGGAENYHACLIELATDAEGHMSGGATWLIKSALENRVELSAELIDNLLARLDKITAWDAQLHICQLVQYLDISEPQARALIPWATPLLDHDRPFLRAWSLDALYRVGQKYPAVVRINPLIERGLADKAASVRARARNLQKV